MKQKRGTVGEYIDGCIHVYLPTYPKPKVGQVSLFRTISINLVKIKKLREMCTYQLVLNQNWDKKYGILALTKRGQNYQIKNIVKKRDGSKV